MKNEHEKLSFIKALIDQLDHQTRLLAKVYFNYPSFNFDVNQQKEVLSELKKKKLISNYRWSDGDFIITNLGFFWERFVMGGSEIEEAVPTPLFRVLQRLQKPPRNREASVGSCGEPQPMAVKNFTPSVMNYNDWGDYWELNPD